MQPRPGLAATCTSPPKQHCIFCRKRPRRLGLRARRPPSSAAKAPGAAGVSSRPDSRSWRPRGRVGDRWHWDSLTCPACVLLSRGGGRGGVGRAADTWPSLSSGVPHVAAPWESNGVEGSRNRPPSVHAPQKINMAHLRGQRPAQSRDQHPPDYSHTRITAPASQTKGITRSAPPCHHQPLPHPEPQGPNFGSCNCQVSKITCRVAR